MRYLGMKCDDLNKLLLWTLVGSIVSDAIFLFIEIINQRCAAKAEKEQAEKERLVNHELAELRSQISSLQQQVFALISPSKNP